MILGRLGGEALPVTAAQIKRKESQVGVCCLEKQQCDSSKARGTVKSFVCWDGHDACRSRSHSTLTVTLASGELEPSSAQFEVIQLKATVPSFKKL